VELNTPISTDEFRMPDRGPDDAIAGAAAEYERERNQSGIDGESARGSECLGFLAHEIRNLLHTALMAFEVKTGSRQHHAGQARNVRYSTFARQTGATPSGDVASASELSAANRCRAERD
jgi:hypothetical protein